MERYQEIERSIIKKYRGIVMKDKLMIADSIKKMITRLDTTIVNFPRSEYVIKDNIMKTCYEMLELVYLANTINDDSRINYQRQVIAKIKMIDFYLKISMEKKYISYKQYVKLGNFLISISKESYGWLNYEKSR